MACGALFGFPETLVVRWCLYISYFYPHLLDYHHLHPTSNSPFSHAQLYQTNGGLALAPRFFNPPSLHH
ncbi:unnamed protein product [Tuber melanosporum]|uniref:(Perigord truffle) hypothetical protein n=1 Tax=Tuber melanosporum (strain Mel28) TaxID=656061 RepID=D5GK01_TUBMM|nr:uncharacterized protein GSTUM_00009294001 [Tuber melanosporum]CAZ84844.1 unnamed protein product [Tuber melanosporum]